MKKKYPFWKPFFALFGLGIAGIVSLLFVIGPQLEQVRALQPELAEMPEPLLVLLVLLQPAILLLVAVAIGCLTAPRVGLVSYVYEKTAFGINILSRLKPQIVPAVILGLIFAVVVMGLDRAFLPFMGEEFRAIEAQEFNLFAQLGMGMLYGGITEELLLRWGFMSLLVWFGWVILGRPASRPPAGVVWVAIAISAILFGVGHLPAMAAMVPLTIIIVVRTILLNAAGGVVFGWLYWRYSLEAAIVSHAFAHVGFFIIRLLSSLFAA